MTKNECFKYTKRMRAEFGVNDALLNSAHEVLFVAGVLLLVPCGNADQRNTERTMVLNIVIQRKTGA